MRNRQITIAVEFQRVVALEIEKLGRLVEESDEPILKPGEIIKLAECGVNPGTKGCDKTLTSDSKAPAAGGCGAPSK